jgi:hypothetical protein
MQIDLNQFEEAMLRQLRAKDSTNPKGYLKRTSCQFVNDYGWFYRPTPLPAGLELANENECYNNALNLALDNPSLTYVEGFAAGPGGLRIHHAWVTDGNGRAIDNTWRVPGIVYAGVPFKCGFVSLTGLRNRGVGSLLDEYTNDWPLLRELSDLPDTWLQVQGKGLMRLADCK